jgi:hypothetical protein
MYRRVPNRRGLGDCYGVDDYGRLICDSQGTDDNPGILPGASESWDSWLYRAATGKPSVEQVTGITDKCAADNVRASAGRLTLDQARALCGRDINAVLPGMSKASWALIGLAMAGALAIGAVVVKR